MRWHVVFYMIVFLGTISICQADSTFSYSYASAGIGQTQLADDIVLGDEVYSRLAAYRITGSYQFDREGVIRASTNGSGNEKTDSYIKVRAWSLGGAYPIPVGSRVDIVPGVSYVSAYSEACLKGDCETADESGVEYSLEGRFWLIPKKVEVNAVLKESNEENSETVTGVGVAAWHAQRSSLRLDVLTTDSANTAFVSFRYTWP